MTTDLKKDIKASPAQKPIVLFPGHRFANDAEGGFRLVGMGSRLLDVHASLPAASCNRPCIATLSRPD